MSLARRASLNIALKALGELGRFPWALLLILVARLLGGESLGRIAFAYSFTTTPFVYLGYVLPARSGRKNSWR